MKDEFLAQLAVDGSVCAAAERLGIDRDVVYRKWLHDLVFAESFTRIRERVMATAVAFKKCPICCLVKTGEEFYKNESGRPRTYCKACHGASRARRLGWLTTIKHCMSCGAQFKTARKKRRFCSRKCRQASADGRRRRMCRGCGSWVVGARHCSFKCAFGSAPQRETRKTASMKKKPSASTPRRLFVCIDCGSSCSCGARGNIARRCGRCNRLRYTYNARLARQSMSSAAADLCREQRNERLALKKMATVGGPLAQQAYLLWLRYKQRTRMKRCSLVVNGESMSIAVAAKRFGVRPWTLTRRIHKLGLVAVATSLEHQRPHAELV